MGTDPLVASEFVEWYGRSAAVYDNAAKQLRRVLSDILDDENVEYHIVLSRKKSLNSLRDKLRSKTYQAPKEQVTDLVGARIIVYYEDDVDRVVDLLREHFEEHPELSIDKRSTLPPSQFGYRSFHQILRPLNQLAKDSQYRDLRDIWCEVQVRTVLEHAWAAIEHEVVYKSGTTLPAELTRRFSAIAGALEILDREFVSLRDECRDLVQARLERLAVDEGLEDELDASWLLACLEHRFPSGMSFRLAADAGSPFPPKVEARVLPILRDHSVQTVQSWLDHLTSESVTSAVERYAANSGSASDEVSHFAILAIAVTLIESTIQGELFQDLEADPAFLESVV